MGTETRPGVRDRTGREKLSESTDGRAVRACPFTPGERARLRTVAVASPGSLAALRSGPGFGAAGGPARGDGGP